MILRKQIELYSFKPFILRIRLILGITLTLKFLKSFFEAELWIKFVAKKGWERI